MAVGTVEAHSGTRLRQSRDPTPRCWAQCFYTGNKNPMKPPYKPSEKPEASRLQEEKHGPYAQKGVKDTTPHVPCDVFSTIQSLNGDCIVGFRTELNQLLHLQRTSTGWGALGRP